VQPTTDSGARGLRCRTSIFVAPAIEMFLRQRSKKSTGRTWRPHTERMGIDARKGQPAAGENRARFGKLDHNEITMEVLSANTATVSY